MQDTKVRLPMYAEPAAQETKDMTAEVPDISGALEEADSSMDDIMAELKGLWVQDAKRKAAQAPRRKGRMLYKCSCGREGASVCIPVSSREVFE